MPSVAFSIEKVTEGIKTPTLTKAGGNGCVLKYVLNMKECNLS
jgi:hypothetical protein